MRNKNNLSHWTIKSFKKNIAQILILPALFLLHFNSLAEDKNAYINQYVPDATIVGQSRLTFLLWDVYDATLYASNGNWSESEPFALELNYLRALKGELIAQRSSEEIKKLGFNNPIKMNQWLKKMESIFPDVKENSVVTGIYLPNEAAIFYLDANFIARIDDPEFALWFFRIWLSEQTSEPKMRKELLNLK